MKQALVNLFGATGYLFVIIQLMWMLIVVGLPVVTQPSFQGFFMPNTQPAQELPQAPRDTLPAPAQIVILAVSIMFSIGIIIYALIKIPSTIGRTGQKLTERVATKTVPIITHHKKINKKRERSLVQRITWGIKAVAILIPALALAVPPGDIIDLEHRVSIVFGLTLAAVAAVNFSLQYILAKLWRVDSRRVW